MMYSVTLTHSRIIWHTQKEHFPFRRISIDGHSYKNRLNLCWPSQWSATPLIELPSDLGKYTEVDYKFAHHDTIDQRSGY